MKCSVLSQRESLDVTRTFIKTDWDRNKMQRQGFRLSLITQ